MPRLRPTFEASANAAAPQNEAVLLKHVSLIPRCPHVFGRASNDGRKHDAARYLISTTSSFICAGVSGFSSRFDFTASAIEWSRPEMGHGTMRSLG